MALAASMKHPEDVVFDALWRVSEAIGIKDGLPTSDEIGLEHSLLMDLYMDGALWVKREDGEMVFGLTPLGRRIMRG